MKDEESLEQDVDLSIGGVPLGKHMKSSSRWSIVGTVAAIIAAICSVVTLVITVMNK
jgi:hypothetical protein